MEVLVTVKRVIDYNVKFRVKVGGLLGPADRLIIGPMAERIGSAESRSIP
jgi:hypothetical protein